LSVSVVSVSGKETKSGASRLQDISRGRSRFPFLRVIMGPGPIQFNEVSPVPGPPSVINRRKIENENDDENDLRAE
jgi:hypothetical protein